MVEVENCVTPGLDELASPRTVGDGDQTDRMRSVRGETSSLSDATADLIAGKNYGSEGTAQRYLTALIIAGPGARISNSYFPSSEGCFVLGAGRVRHSGATRCGSARHAWP